MLPPVFYLFVCLLNIPSMINPDSNKIYPPTKGNPEPTRSSIHADHKNEKQNSIPKTPAKIDVIASPLTIILIVLSVIFIEFKSINIV
jgi:hypothetical protein